MSLSGKDSSSGSRGNPPNGRKRRLSSRSRNSNSHNSSSSSSRTISSYSLNNRGKEKATSSSPRTKKQRLSSVGSPSHKSEFPDRVSADQCSSVSTSSLELESDMAQIPFSSMSGQSPFGNNFKGGGVNNHKRPGQGKKIIIKNRKGKGLSVASRIVCKYAGGIREILYSFFCYWIG